MLNIHVMLNTDHYQNVKNANNLNPPLIARLKSLRILCLITEPTFDFKYILRNLTMVFLIFMI